MPTDLYICICMYIVLLYENGFTCAKLALWEFIKSLYYNAFRGFKYDILCTKLLPKIFSYNDTASMVYA